MRSGAGPRANVTDSNSEATVRPQDLMGTDECFITNTTSEIMPVTMVDKNPIGNGKPGSITMTLHQAYKKEVPCV